MKVKVLITVLSLLSVTRLYSQSSIKGQNSFAIFPAVLDYNHLTIYGFSNSILTDYSSYSLSNSAIDLNSNTKIVSFNYQYTTKNKSFLFGNIELDKKTEIYPNSFILFYPAGNTVFSVSYNNLYSYSLGYGDIRITTENSTDGNDKFFTPKFNYYVHQISTSFNTSFNSIFNETDKLAIGFSGNYNYLTGDERILETKSNFDDHTFSFSGGLVYTNSNSEKISLYYTHQIHFEGSYQLDGSLSRVLHDPVRGDTYAVAARIYYDQQIPSSVSFGYSNKLNESSQWYAQFTNTFWSSNKTVYSDQRELSGGFITRLNDQLSGVFGSNYLYQKLDVDSFWGDTNASALFFVYGFQYDFDKFNFGAVMAESYLTNSISKSVTSDRRKELITKFILSYAF